MTTSDPKQGMALLYKEDLSDIITKDMIENEIISGNTTVEVTNMNIVDGETLELTLIFHEGYLN